MDWTPGGMSDDIEDRRGDSGGGGGFNFGGGVAWESAALAVLLIVSLITGRNFIGSYLTGGSPTQQSRPVSSQNLPESADEQRSTQLVSFVLDDVQRTWLKFWRSRKSTTARVLVLFRGTYSGCGTERVALTDSLCP